MKTSVKFSYKNLQKQNLYFTTKKKFILNRFKNLYNLNINKLTNYSKNTDLNLYIDKNYQINNFFKVNLNNNIKYLFFKNIFYTTTSKYLFNFIYIQFLFTYFTTTNLLQVPNKNNFIFDWSTVNTTLLYRFNNLYNNSNKPSININLLYINKVSFYYNLNFYNLKLFLNKIKNYSDNLKFTKTCFKHLTTKQLYLYNNYNKLKYNNIIKLKNLKQNYKINNIIKQKNLKQNNLNKFNAFKYSIKSKKYNKYVIHNMRNVWNLVKLTRFINYYKKNLFIMKQENKHLKLFTYLVNKNKKLLNKINKELNQNSKYWIKKPLNFVLMRKITSKYYKSFTTYHLYSYNFKHKTKRTRTYRSSKYKIKFNDLYLFIKSYNIPSKKILKNDRIKYKRRLQRRIKFLYQLKFFVLKNYKHKVYKLKRINQTVLNYQKNLKKIKKLNKYYLHQIMARTPKVTKIYIKRNSNKIISKIYKKRITRLYNINHKRIKYLNKLITKKLNIKLKKLRYNLKCEWFTHLKRNQTVDYEETTFRNNRNIRPRVRLFKKYTRYLFYCFSYFRKRPFENERKLKSYFWYRYNKYKSYQQHIKETFFNLRNINNEEFWQKKDRCNIPKFVLFTQLHINTKHILNIQSLKVKTKKNRATPKYWISKNTISAYPILKKISYVRYKRKVKTALDEYLLWFKNQKHIKQQLNKNIYINKYLQTKYLINKNLTDIDVLFYTKKSKKITPTVTKLARIFKWKNRWKNINKLKIKHKKIKGIFIQQKYIKARLRRVYFYLKNNKNYKSNIYNKNSWLIKFNKTIDKIHNKSNIKNFKKLLNPINIDLQWFKYDYKNNFKYQLNFKKLNWRSCKILKKLVIYNNCNNKLNLFTLNKNFNLKIKIKRLWFKKQINNYLIPNELNRNEFYIKKQLDYNLYYYFKKYSRYLLTPITNKYNYDFTILKFNFYNWIVINNARNNFNTLHLYNTYIKKTDTSYLYYNNFLKQLNSNYVYKKFTTYLINNTNIKIKKQLIRYIKSKIPFILIINFFLKYYSKFYKFKKKKYHKIKMINTANYRKLKVNSIISLFKNLLIKIPQQLNLKRRRIAYRIADFNAESVYLINRRKFSNYFGKNGAKLLEQERKVKYNKLMKFVWKPKIRYLKWFQKYIKKMLKKRINNVKKFQKKNNYKKIIINYENKKQFIKWYTRKLIRYSVNQNNIAMIYKNYLINQVSKNSIIINFKKNINFNSSSLYLNKNLKCLNLNNLWNIAALLKVNFNSLVNLYFKTKHIKNKKKLKSNTKFVKKLFIVIYKNFIIKKKFTKYWKFFKHTKYNWLKFFNNIIKNLIIKYNSKLVTTVIKKIKQKSIKFGKNRIKTLNSKSLKKLLVNSGINKLYIKSKYNYLTDRSKLKYYNKPVFFHNKKYNNRVFNKILKHYSRSNYNKLVNQTLYKFKYFCYLSLRERKKISVWGYHKYNRRYQHTTYLRKVRQYFKTFDKNERLTSMLNYNSFKNLNLHKNTILNLNKNNYYKLKIITKLNTININKYLNVLNIKNYWLRKLCNFTNFKKLNKFKTSKFFKIRLIDYKNIITTTKIITKSYMQSYYNYWKCFTKYIKFKMIKLQTNFSNFAILESFAMSKNHTLLSLTNFNKLILLNKTLIAGSINIFSFKLFLNTIFAYPSILMLSNKLYNLTNKYTKMTSEMNYFKHKKFWDGWLNFNNNLNFHFFNHLVTSFVEFHTAKKVGFLIHFNDYDCIPLEYRIILNMWIYRVDRFHYIFNRVVRLKIIMKLFYLVTANQDLHLLMKIITKLTPKIQYRNHRRFFKFIIFIFRAYFVVLFKNFNVKGMQFEFAGKISVTGNARTRKMYYKLGKPSRSTYTYSTKYIYKTISTYMGVLGVKIWIFH